jgi:hypothetical protein
MNELTTQPDPVHCDEGCGAPVSIEALNRTCYCLNLDRKALRDSLESDLSSRGLSRSVLETHPNLFASLPLFVSRIHLERMANLVKVVEAVVATPAFFEAALAWAPGIAAFDPGTLGGLLGFDFHLGVAGPQLIEINTNPGGALLNAVLARAQRACCRDAAGLAMGAMETPDVEEALVGVFIAEWGLQRKGARLTSLAIVDEAPEAQYLYPEFLLYQRLLDSHGIQVTICDPQALIRKDGRLWHENMPVDFVYNRLTDFALERPGHTALKQSYLAREVVVSPNPHAHALYADKRNLTLLCDEAFLREAGLPEHAATTLLAMVPRTETMTADNRDALWTRRRQLFFKPAAGYGSKATYRGDKLTKRVWEEMAKTTYVAQALVPPSERHVAKSQPARSLKADVRNYAYAGVVKLVAARLYQGQTTNFRTSGGGFAPVFTETP